MLHQFRSFIRRQRFKLEQTLGISPKLNLDTIQDKVWLGSIYGGWWVCPSVLSSESIVYSIGVGTDISFDLALIRQFHVTVHAFDPTPLSIEWIKQQDLPKLFIMHELGIADRDGVVEFYSPKIPGHVSHSTVPQRLVTPEAIQVPVVKLSTIMNQLGHTHIDLLKMDIEGAEYSVIADILQMGIPVKQFLMEFHHRHITDGKAKTENALNLLRSHGYLLFAHSDLGTECSLLHVSQILQDSRTL